jgi:hypothetical protein
MRERITCSGGSIMQPDACARVKILQHAHEELVEQSADVPLEVEQAAEKIQNRRTFAGSDASGSGAP